MVVVLMPHTWKFLKFLKFQQKKLIQRYTFQREFLEHVMGLCKHERGIIKLNSSPIMDTGSGQIARPIPIFRARRF